MTDEATLLKAVLDAPDDDAPRLAYAQWSDAQGDAVSVARGELIRAQIDLMHTSPEVIKAGRAFGVQHRIEALIDRHGATWAGAIAGWVDAVHFVRGFVGWIKLSAQRFLDHGDSIMALAPVQHLDLTGVRDVDEALFDSPLLAHIRSLSMDACGLHDLHVQMLAASPHVTHLRWLSVADNHLTLAAAEALAASPFLRDLRYAELRGNPTDPVERLGYDSGIVVASWMPPEGKDIEARFGHQPWLHRDVIPGRFEA
ncbi:TIGR02996 domain-containing protein [Sorangium sp. So ce1078]|uniref:TIGR02996 domain-containing protein n=1 Tax=Sorangium sp. So ce1078 TaxID=3133329 RepID=UPI003F62CFEF